ncbi:MAG: adenosylcobinamide-GDP ribazoletransferase [Desulfarculaceae bacterium]|nr:adenosylcobinamide-GDP ribazoletransferase [Desulfarculaceae bacterium]MCF8074417.1 adenosylcobinamide-GDP ribazoletransferase [Desulfarculaceae bacterium]MCF8103607.1 adenosylcobinamide-GDP ribazoletransferase [Desulfarculaceae bacterium]MCF8116020.1 adenosylcobinamide-GDP ribazoletransferase [Desulfarculaceae bacterium]
MTSFILALQFLTVATVNSGLRAGPGDLARSRAWHGVVGGLLGLVLALAAWLLGLWLPPLVLAGVLVLLWGALTRFLHYDGVADTADALVHTTSRERALEIMKDTRLGSFGVAAIAAVMLVKFGALASLGGAALWGGLMAAPALGRGLEAVLSSLLPAARPGVGLGAAVAQGGELWPGLAGGASALIIAILALGAAGAWAALGVLALGLVLGLWFRRRIGGVTGDTLGAAIECGELVSLIVLASIG